MSEMLPEGEDLRRAVRWISGERLVYPDKPLLALVNEAVFQFDLSPKDAESLIALFRKDKAP